MNDILNNDNSKRDFFRSAAALSLATGVLGVAGTPREAMAQMRRGYTATADALPTHEEFLRKAGAWAASDVRSVQP